MSSLQYDKKYFGPFGSKLKCAFCGKILKGEMVEILGLKYFIEQTYFCEGHLIKWIKQQQREFLLSKI